jgi:hypothetical protein
VLVLKPFLELTLATERHVIENGENAGTCEVISIVVARHESLPSLPCNYLKIELPLVGDRVGASHAIACAFGQEPANGDNLRQVAGPPRLRREFLRGRGEVCQAAALCEDSAIRKRNLNTLDAEIDAFNDLIAVQCIGS